MLKFLSSKRGSFTVEASIVFPIVFLCIIAVIYICLLLYQMTYVQAAADRAVERGTATWSNQKKIIYTGEVPKEELSAGGLYWRLFDVHKKEKVSRLENYFKDQIGQYDVLKGKYTLQEPVTSDYIVYKKLSVDIESEYSIPAGRLLRCFGLRDRISLKVHSEAVINQPVEFIRNTDFVMDIEKEVEQNNEGVARLGSSVRDFMQKIMDTVVKFFDKK